jgi:type I restriction enzyme S subunit
MRSHYKRIGDYVAQIKLKNANGSISCLKGININKHFMPSVANINGTDLSKYRVVKKNQFAFNPMHVGRDEVLPISILESDQSIIVSPAYVVFEVKDEEELLPEYLMMWCRRTEFDRNAWFMTDNSVRGGFSWADFCDMELPIPSTDKQREIVREYNVVNDRIVLNEQLIKKLEDIAQAIYKQWFIDFDFPISKEYAESIGNQKLEGSPYKSSGGKMEFCEEYDNEIPRSFSYLNLGNLISYKKGNAFKSSDYAEDGIKIVKVSNFKGNTVDGKDCQCIKFARRNEFQKYLLAQGDILISTVGSWPNNPASIVGQVVKIPKNMDGAFLNQNVVKLQAKNESFQNTLMLALSRKEFSDYVVTGAQGSANQASVTLDHLFSYPIIQGEKNTELNFSRLVASLDKHRSNIEEEKVSLLAVKNMLLKKLAKA